MSFFHMLDGDGMVHRELLSCRYSSGGGMDGGSIRMLLERTDGGACRFSFTEKPFWDSEEESGSFTLPRDVMDTLERLVNLCHVYRWGKLPESEIFALDAPSVSVELRYHDQEVFLSDRDEFPKEGTGILYDIYSVLTDCKNKKFV